jgi:hypothetical protein
MLLHETPSSRARTLTLSPMQRLKFEVAPKLAWFAPIGVSTVGDSYLVYIGFVEAADGATAGVIANVSHTLKPEGRC